jgi:hypothetical protein
MVAPLPAAARFIQNDDDGYTQALEPPKSQAQQWLKTKYGVRVMLMVVPHSFSRHLTFNAHLHILVSSGGLKESEGRWISNLPLNKRALMHM